MKNPFTFNNGEPNWLIILIYVVAFFLLMFIMLCTPIQ